MALRTAVPGGVVVPRVEPSPPPATKTFEEQRREADAGKKAAPPTDKTQPLLVSHLKTLEQAKIREDERVKAATETLKQVYRGITPWAEEKGERATPARIGIMAAEILVPGVYAARHWRDLSGGERAFTIALDVASLIPFAGAITRGARVVGTTGKAARIAGAVKGAGKEAVALVRAPVDVVLHPIATAKTAARETRNIIENVAHPHKIPEAVVTTSEGTVRLRLSEASSVKDAMRARDTLMDLAAKGERPVVEIKGIKYELTHSPLMEKTRGGLVHATPSGEAFERGLLVTAKKGVAVEQGLFVSHEPLPRFTKASAFGKTGEKSAFVIMSPETAKMAIPTGKVFRGTVELEKKFPVGVKLPAPAQKLFTRIGPSGHKVEIYLETPLTRAQRLSLKSAGLAETLKAPFKPPIKVTGKMTSGLTKAEVDKLAKVLDDAGNTGAAGVLRRSADRIVTARRVGPSMARIPGAARARISQAEARRLVSGVDTRKPRVETSAERTTRVRAEEVAISRGKRRVVDDAGVRRPPTGEEPTRRPPTDEEPSRKPPPEEDEPRRLLTDEETPRKPPPEEDEIRKPPSDEDERRRPPPEEDEPTRRPPIRGILPSASDKDKRKVIKKAKGAVAFRMGEIGKKDVWHVIMYPYQSQEDYLSVIGRTPRGAVVARGKGSAFRTAHKLFGKMPGRALRMDIGAMDATLTPGAKEVGIRFRPDPGQITTGDITITKRARPITTGRTPRITRKMPRLR